jgi:hypothetical protein
MEIKFLSGYKTYIAAILLIAWAIWGGIAGFIDGAKATELVLLALSIIGLRSSIEEVKETIKAAK